MFSDIEIQAPERNLSVVESDRIVHRQDEFLTVNDAIGTEEHTLNVSAAYAYGIKEALLLRAIAQAVLLESLGAHGQVWVNFTFNNLERLFPYLSVGTIFNVLHSLKTRRLLEVKEWIRGCHPKLGGWYSLPGNILEYASGSTLPFRVSEAMDIGLHNALLLSWIRTLTSMNQRIGRSLVLKRNTILRFPLSLDQVKRGLSFFVKAGKVHGSGGGYTLNLSEEKPVGSGMRRNFDSNLYA